MMYPSYLEICLENKRLPDIHLGDAVGSCTFLLDGLQRPSDSPKDDPLGAGLSHFWTVFIHVTFAVYLLGTRSYVLGI